MKRIMLILGKLLLMIHSAACFRASSSNSKPKAVDNGQKTDDGKDSPLAGYFSSLLYTKESPEIRCKRCGKCVSSSSSSEHSPNQEMKSKVFRASIIAQYSICICVRCYLAHIFRHYSGKDLFSYRLCNYYGSSYQYESLIEYVDFRFKFPIDDVMNGKIEYCDVLVAMILYDLLEDGYGLLLICSLKFSVHKIVRLKEYVARVIPSLLKVYDEFIDSYCLRYANDSGVLFASREAILNFRKNVYRRFDHLDDVIDGLTTNIPDDPVHIIGCIEATSKYCISKCIYNAVIAEHAPVKILNSINPFLYIIASMRHDASFNNEIQIIRCRYTLRMLGTAGMHENSLKFLESIQLSNSQTRYAPVSEYITWYLDSHSIRIPNDLSAPLHFIISNGLRNYCPLIDTLIDSSKPSDRRDIKKTLSPESSDSTALNSRNRYTLLLEILKKLEIGTIGQDVVYCLNYYLGYAGRMPGYCPRDYASVSSLMVFIAGHPKLIDEIDHSLYIGPYWQLIAPENESIEKKIDILVDMHRQNFKFTIPFLTREFNVASPEDARHVLSVIKNGTADKPLLNALFSLVQCLHCSYSSEVKDAFAVMMDGDHGSIAHQNFLDIFVTILKSLDNPRILDHCVQAYELSKLYILMQEVFIGHITSYSSTVCIGHITSYSSTVCRSPSFQKRSFDKRAVCLFYMRLINAKLISCSNSSLPDTAQIISYDSSVKSLCIAHFDAIWECITSARSNDESVLHDLHRFFASFELEDVLEGRPATTFLMRIVGISLNLPFSTDLIMHTIYPRDARICKAYKMVFFNREYLKRGLNPGFKLSHKGTQEIQNLCNRHLAVPRTERRRGKIIEHLARIFNREKAGLENIDDDLCDTILKLI